MIRRAKDEEEEDTKKACFYSPKKISKEVLFQVTNYCVVALELCRRYFITLCANLTSHSW